ncbi:MAG: hypothetical protein C4321_08565, partial [Chloroflexota bacterium]
AGGLNLWAYVGNNPVGHVDPSGLQAEEIEPEDEGFGEDEVDPYDVHPDSSWFGWEDPDDARLRRLGVDPVEQVRFNLFLRQFGLHDPHGKFPPTPWGGLTPEGDGLDPCEETGVPFNPDIEAARRWAVAEAWRQERDLVASGRPGTRRWTPAERAELLQTGRVSGYVGHHGKSVAESPEEAGNPDNIHFVNPNEHFKRYGGNWQNPTEETFVSRRF